MVFWASMYGTCTRRKDGPYVFIYLKHAPSFGDNGSSYIFINTPPSFGDSGSPDIFNTRSHLAITIHLPVHHISLTRPLFCRFRFIIYLKPRPLIWRFRYPIYLKHLVDPGPSYILNTLPSVGDNGSSYVLNTPPSFGILNHISKKNNTI